MGDVLLGAMLLAGMAAFIAGYGLIGYVVYMIVMWALWLVLSCARLALIARCRTRPQGARLPSQTIGDPCKSRLMRL